MTFFEWPELPKGQIGLGSPHHLAYTVPKMDALPEWKAWLHSKGVPVVGPLVRDHNRVSLYLRDPDGVVIEITSPNAENISNDYFKDHGESSVSSISMITSDMRLATFNHATPITSDASLTVRFFSKLLGLKNSFTLPNEDQKGTSVVGIGNADRPDFLRYILYEKAPDGLVGEGNIHHIAMAVDDDGDQLKIKRRLDDGGFANSGIIDRFWFHSLYFRDPDGNLLEIATKVPGYTADEPLEKLGQKLVLPAWLETRRHEIESALKETDGKNKRPWPPNYSALISPPESLPAAAS
ncbi:MAG: VOC family protein [Nitrososphaerales archaeon]